MMMMIMMMMRTTTTTRTAYPATLMRSFYVEMHDEIFHFEIFKNFMKILKYFKTPF